jgi:hypothetical protein
VVRIIAKGYTTILFTAKQYIDYIHCCETAADAENVANMALPCAYSHTHDFNSYFYPQDGVINGHQPNKNHVFNVFDTECIQEIDNFQIYIDVFTNETKCLHNIRQDLLPISILIPKYIQMSLIIKS